MPATSSAKSGTVVCLACALTASLHAFGADPVALRHVGHVRDGDLQLKHVMGVETILDHYALVVSGQGLCLIDLDTVVPGATGPCLDLIPQPDATTTATRPDGISYVNLRQAGISIVRVDPLTHSLTSLGTIGESGVFFDKMALVGDRLYVAAHAYGIRVYDVSFPTNPQLVGRLDSGFDDAFAIAVSGQTAYVADGAGGLKIVDLSDETAPVIVAGEDPQTAAGTAEDVLVHGGRVYVASGGAGVAVYDAGDLQSRTLYETPHCAKHLAVVGDYLAVADIRGLELFSIEPDGSLIRAAGETGTYRVDGVDESLRMWHGVAAWGAERVVVADWDALDVYELVDPALDDQPDIEVSSQRLRFAPQGGSLRVRLSSNGSAPLQVDAITSSDATFTVSPTNAFLLPGESLELTITYSGGPPGEATVRVYSNDPDESPMPIQVFGETAFLDPGEPAIPFNLVAWRFDQRTEQFFESTFDLQSYAGKVVYFHVFSTW